MIAPRFIFAATLISAVVSVLLLWKLRPTFNVPGFGVDDRNVPSSSLENHTASTKSNPTPFSDTPMPHNSTNRGDTLPEPIVSTSPPLSSPVLPPIGSLEDERPKIVNEILNTFAIGILTTKSKHSRLIQQLDSWWNISEFRDLVTVFSDTDDGNLTNSRIIPNVVNTNCETTYNYGLWCKNTWMWKYWRSQPRFSNTKWFLRVMDDSYIHLENLLDLVSNYDFHEKIVLGDKHCYWTNHDYPSGGPGVLFSRGVLDDFNETDWTRPHLEKRRKNDIGNFFDDVAWGDYLHYRKIPVTNHMGIEQAANKPHSSQWNYWLRFEKGLGRLWNLPYRPLMLHQHGDPMPMTLVHQKLHSLSYTPLSPQLVDVPPCNCPPGKHQKCIWNQAYTDSGQCHWGFDRMICIGPGPWDFS